MPIDDRFSRIPPILSLMHNTYFITFFDRICVPRSHFASSLNLVTIKRIDAYRVTSGRGSDDAPRYDEAPQHVLF